MSKNSRIIILLVFIILIVLTITVQAHYIMNKKQNIIINSATSNVSVMVNDSTNSNLTGNLESETSTQKYTVKVINNNNYDLLYNITTSSEHFIITGGITNGTATANSTTTTTITVLPDTNYRYEEDFETAQIIIDITAPFKIATKTYNCTITTYKYTITDVVEDEYPETDITTPSFDESVTTEDNSGLFTAETQSGEVLYFRGVVNNNYVNFADKLWRIVSIDSEGNCKLILDEPIGRYEFTNSKTNVSYNSTLKTTLQDWYADNLLEYNSYIKQDAIFWQDRRSESTGANASIYRTWERILNNQPSVDTTGISTTYLYTISGVTTGNQQLTYPIGLLTADEIMLAGAACTTGSTLTGGPNSDSSNYKPNESFYIANGVDTTYGMWTLSPYSTTAIIVFKPRVGFYKETPYAGNGGRSVKPVIVLKSTTKIKGGDGTKGNPYTIKY